MSRTAFLRALPGILLAAAVLIPFGDKAYTVDDTIFLMESRQALQDPLHPTAVDVVWLDVPTRVSVLSGPAQAWLLMPAVAAGGEEWIAHAAVFVAFALALYATVALALRLGVKPTTAGAAGLFLGATPAALAMAGTAMPDVLAMSLGVLGLERLVAWRDDGRLHQAVAAVLLLGFAPHARSHLIVLFLVGSILLVKDCFSLKSWRDGRLHVWLPMIAAPAATAIALVVIRPADAGAVQAVGPAQLSAAENLLPNVLAFFVHWALALPLALPWAILRPREVFGRWWVVVAGTIGAGALIRSTGVGPLAVAPFAGVSLAVLWDIFADAWKRRDPVQLALGVWLLVPLAPAPYPHLPSKYLLAAAPAAAILVARAAAARNDLLARITVIGTAVAGVLLGVAILRADAAFADVGRRAARELIAPNVVAGHRVWFAGHWGFQWYAETAGARCVTLTPPYPQPGDLVVEAMRTDVGGQIRRLLRTYPRTVLGQVADRTPGGRLLDRRLGAGFFSNRLGYLPWAWGDDLLDAFVLYRID